MDGVQMMDKSSLRGRLSLGLMALIFGVALIAGAFSYFAALDEALEWQDNMLRQVATQSYEPYLTSGGEGPQPHDRDKGETDHIFIQLIGLPSIGQDTHSATRLALPPWLPDGLQTVQINKVSYRLFVRTLVTGPQLVVAQSTGERDEMARDGALRTLLPFFILIPLLLFVVGRMVHHFLAPVIDTAHDINQRKEFDLYPLPHDNLPTEIHPFVIALNNLFGRIEQSMEMQRRFVADAAHELRSPLTALSLQAERLANTELSETARERLEALSRGIERSRVLLNQLLDLARAQSTVDHTVKPISLQSVFRLVLENIMPLAVVKNIDIGVVDTADAMVKVSEIDLITLIRNLVMNAIQYTPPGRCVDLSVEKTPKGVIFKVKDNGPGIPEEDRERVFDPFYRILGSDQTGSGLGLSIVKAISDRIGAIVSIDNSDENLKTGLTVTVFFPDL